MCFTQTRVRTVYISSTIRAHRQKLCQTIPTLLAHNRTQRFHGFIADSTNNANASTKN